MHFRVYLEHETLLPLSFGVGGGDGPSSDGSWNGSLVYSEFEGSIVTTKGTNDRTSGICTSFPLPLLNPTTVEIRQN